MERHHTSFEIGVFIDFAAQAKLALLESAGAPALHIHTLPFGLNPGVATKAQVV